MKTAIDILRDATDAVGKSLGKDIHFHHGNTVTVVNYVTELQKLKSKAYPAVIVFTEGMTEVQDEFWIDFTIPKVAICKTTKLNATEKQRLESNFKKIIYPVFESLKAELEKLHYGYNLVLNRTDIPYFPTPNNKQVFNQLVDGCLIKNLKMKVLYEPC